MNDTARELGAANTAIGAPSTPSASHDAPGVGFGVVQRSGVASNVVIFIGPPVVAPASW